MLSLDEIINVIEKVAPLSEAAEWDNSGLLYGGGGQKIKKVLLTLDLTPAVAEEALSCGVDMIIEHHPSLFSPVKKFTSDMIEEKSFLKVAGRGIAVYASHTASDFALKGLNYYFANKLGLKDVERKRDGDEVVFIGKISKTDLKSLKEKVAEIFGDQLAFFVGDGEKVVETVGVVTGGGGSVGSAIYARDNGADVYISGDVKYHCARWTKDSGYAIINLSHYASEIIFIDYMAEILKNCDVEIIKSVHCVNPYN